jgi:hypothetical protein
MPETGRIIHAVGVTGTCFARSATVLKPSHHRVATIARGGNAQGRSWRDRVHS